MARTTTQTAASTSKWLGWRVLALLAPHRLAVTGLALLVTLTAGLDIAVPFITRGVIDGVVRALQSAKTGSYRSLLLAASAIFALTAITRALRSLYNYRLFRLVSNAEDEAKNAAFSNFLHLDAEYHGAVNTGEVIGALDRGATAVFVVLYEIFGQNLLPPTLIVRRGDGGSIDGKSADRPDRVLAPPGLCAGGRAPFRADAPARVSDQPCLRAGNEGVLRYCEQRARGKEVLPRESGS